MESRMNRVEEFRYLLVYTAQSHFDNELSRFQLRSLWTAYCFHQNIDVDTAIYDNDLLDLWNIMDKSVPAVTCDADWSCYDRFEKFMCAYLV